MSRNIEENVVKMRFDNEEFDSNIEESQSTLNSFKDTILSLPQNIYIGISNALSKINLADIIGVGAALAGIGLVKSAIEGIGFTVANVAANALRSIENVFAVAINQINTGGKQRALNIANAKFQIEGLGLEVKTFMDAADYAVSGTAYGLDAAAKVASQLGASGITQLEELKKALRGVSGVAAMTNSSYEEIGHIFTVISSNGKLMTENLRSFSAKGLNVAAILGKQLNKSESEISSMVTKGQIDFKTFYTAMDEAFGEHAKDANKTFEGAMSNVRAALSRIGEGLWTPILDNAINVFNELRLAINAFNAALKDVDGANSFNIFGEMIKSVYDNVAHMIKLIRYAINETSFMDEFGSTFMAISNLVKNVFEAISFDYGFTVNTIFENLAKGLSVIKRLIIGFDDFLKTTVNIRKLGGEFHSLVKWISSFADIFTSIFNQRENSVGKLLESWYKGLTSVISVIKDILGINRKGIESIFTGAVNAVFDLIEKLTLSDDWIDKITRTFRGAASALDIIKMLALTIFENVIKPVVGFIPYIVDGILTISAKLGDWVYELRNAIKEETIFEKTFEKIKEIILFVIDAFKSVGTNFFDAFFGNPDDERTFLDRIKDFVKSLLEDISGLFDGLDVSGLDLSPISEFLKNLASFGLSDEEQTDVENNANWIKKILNKIKEFFTSVKEFFTGISSAKEAEDASGSDSSGFIEKLGETVGSVLTNIFGFITDVGFTDAEIAGMVVLIYLTLDMVKDVILAFFDFVLKMTETLTGKVASAEPSKLVDLLAQFVDKVRPDDIFSKIHVFMTDLKNINFAEILYGYKNKDTITSVMTSISDFLKSFGSAMLMIAASLFIISMIPEENMKRATDTLIQMGTMLGILIGAIIVINNVTHKVPRISQNIQVKFNPRFFGSENSGSVVSPMFAVAGIIAAIGAAMLLIASALFIISKINPDAIDSGILIMALFSVYIASLIAIISGLSKNNERMSGALSTLPFIFATFALLMIAIAAAIATMAGTFSNVEAGKVWQSLAIISIILIEMAAIIAAVTALSMSDKDAAITGAIAVLMSFIPMIGAILAIAIAIKLLSNIEEDKLTTAAVAIGAILGVMGIIAAVIVAAAGLIGNAGPQALIGMGIACGILLAIAVDILALGYVAKQAAVIIDSITKLVAGIVGLFAYFSNLDDASMERAVKNVGRAIVGIAAAIPQAFAQMSASAMDGIKKILPSIMEFLSGTILPYLVAVPKLLFPKLLVTIMQGSTELINAIVQFLPGLMDSLWDLVFGSGDLFNTMMEWLDRIWDDTTEWMVGRIPTWVQDIYSILITLVRAINDVLEENWDELDTELQRLIDNTIKFINDLLLGEKTTEDINSMIGALIESIKNVIIENIPLIEAAFKEMGMRAGISFVDSLEEWLPGNMDLSGMLEGYWFGDDDVYSNPNSYASNGYNVTAMGQSHYPYSSDWTSADTSAVTNAIESSKTDRQSNLLGAIADGLGSMINNGKKTNKETLNVENVINIDSYQESKATTKVNRWFQSMGLGQ